MTLPFFHISCAQPGCVCPSPTLLCITGRLTLCFPDSGWFWTMDAQIGKSEKKMQNMDYLSLPPTHTFFLAFSSVQHLCIFCSFHSLIIWSHDCRFLSVNTGPWFGLNSLFILFLLIGIGGDSLLFHFQLFSYLGSQIKSHLIENTQSGFYFSDNPD